MVDVLGDQFSATLCWGAVPDPVTDCAVGPFEALLPKVTFADAEPVACGANVTENDIVYPAGMVTGNAIPLKANCDWLTVADDTVTGPLLAVKVADCAWVVPSTTLPKFMLVGEMINCPGAIPEPLRGIDNVGFDPFELTTRLPVAVPPTSGANATVKLMLWPADRVTGGAIPVREKPVPLVAT